MKCCTVFESFVSAGMHAVTYMHLAFRVWMRWLNTKRASHRNTINNLKHWPNRCKFTKYAQNEQSSLRQISTLYFRNIFEYFLTYVRSYWEYEFLQILCETPGSMDSKNNLYFFRLHSQYRMCILVLASWRSPCSYQCISFDVLAC